MDTKTQREPNEEDEEEYIDMEVSSSSSTSLITSTQSREFEFQMCLPASSSSFSSSSIHKRETISSADELFYNGKLLPLHLPPRLQLVQQLQTQTQTQTRTQTHEPTSNLGFSFTAPPTTTTTPLESPSQSCRVSCELNRHDYNNLFNWRSSTEMSSSSCSFLSQQGAPQRKLFWPSKKMKLIKQSSLIAQKLRASRSYLKSFFTKSACSSDSLKEKGNNNIAVEGNQYMKVSKQSSIFDQIESLSSSSTRNNNDNDNNTTVVPNRRSFSGAIKRHCGGVKCMSSFTSSSSSSNCSSNSSSFSVKSDGFYELNLVKSHSTSDVSSEIENAIEGAIAHCKNSQQEQQCVITGLKGSGSSLLLKQNVGGCGHHGRIELCRI